MNYDLVLVKHKSSDTLYLFKAPANSGLIYHNIVMVETKKGEEEGEVVEVLVDVNEDSDIYRFISLQNQRRKIKRVYSKIEQIRLNYEEDLVDKQEDATLKELDALTTQAKELTNKYKSIKDCLPFLIGGIY